MSVGDQFNPCFDLACPGIVLNGSSGNKANAVATVVLTPVTDPLRNGARLAYITGFELTGAGATAASVITGTVAGLGGASSTITFIVAIPAGATIGVQLIVEFAQPLPASAPGQAITVSFPAFGVGSTNACLNAHGFEL